MFKLIIFVVGLGIGFGGGIYYGVNHPTEAAVIAAKEKAQVQNMENKASQMMNPQPSNPR